MVTSDINKAVEPISSRRFFECLSGVVGMPAHVTKLTITLALHDPAVVTVERRGNVSDAEGVAKLLTEEYELHPKHAETG